MFMMNTIDTIAHQIELLLVISVIIHETSLFIIAHGTFMMICAFSAYVNTTDLFSFYLKINNMDKLNLIVYNHYNYSSNGWCLYILTIAAIANGI